MCPHSVQPGMVRLWKINRGTGSQKFEFKCQASRALAILVVRLLIPEFSTTVPNFQSVKKTEAWNAWCWWWWWWWWWGLPWTKTGAQILGGTKPSLSGKTSVTACGLSLPGQARAQALARGKLRREEKLAASFYFKWLRLFSAINACTASLS